MVGIWMQQFSENLADEWVWNGLKNLRATYELQAFIYWIEHIYNYMVKYENWCYGAIRDVWKTDILEHTGWTICKLTISKKILYLVISQSTLFIKFPSFNNIFACFYCWHQSILAFYKKKISKLPINRLETLCAALF